MNLKVIRQIDLFRNLDPVQLAHLAGIVQERTLPTGTVLFREGDHADFFYVIVKGAVRISKVVAGMGEEALAVLREGAYFGEMEFINGHLPRAAQAMVHEDCQLQVFPYNELHALMKADHELGFALLWSMVETLSERLRATNDKVIAMFAMAQFDHS